MKQLCHTGVVITKYRAYPGMASSFNYNYIFILGYAFKTLANTFLIYLRIRIFDVVARESAVNQNRIHIIKVTVATCSNGQ